MGRRRMKLYRKMKAAALTVTGKTADRIILDCTMASSFVNSTNATDFANGQKKNRSLVRTRTPQYRRRGTGK